MGKILVYCVDLAVRFGFLSLYVMATATVKSPEGPMGKVSDLRTLSPSCTIPGLSRIPWWISRINVEALSRIPSMHVNCEVDCEGVNCWSASLRMTPTCSGVSAMLTGRSDIVLILTDLADFVKNPKFANFEKFVEFEKFRIFHENSPNNNGCFWQISWKLWNLPKTTNLSKKVFHRRSTMFDGDLIF